MCYRKFVTWSEYLRIVLVCCLTVTAVSLPEVIKIGGIFDIDEDEQELAFRYAIDRINTDNNILPKSRLSPLVKRLAPFDAFHASKIVCDFLKPGVAVIFGPRSPTLSNIIQSTCETFGVPNIFTWWDIRLCSYQHSINIYPDLSALNKACLDFVNLRRWEKFTIIYENNEDLIRYKDLLSLPINYNKKITLRQLSRGMTYRKLLKRCRENGDNNIILDIAVQKLIQVFHDAEEVGMLTEYHNYLITSLDFHTLDLKEFHLNTANITAFRLVDPTRRKVIDVIRDWIFGELRYGRPVKKGHVLKTERALLYDSLVLFSRALEDLDRSQSIRINPLNCSNPEITTYGKSVVSYMKMLHLDGLTGVVKFNDKGHREDVTFDVLELHRGVSTKVGSWNTKAGFNYARELYSSYGDITQTLRNKTLRVTTIVHPPFSMRKPNPELKGNERYHGYCIDLLREISRQFEFSYEISLAKDNRYGSKNKCGEWNGMIRELIDRIKSSINLIDQRLFNVLLHQIRKVSSNVVRMAIFQCTFRYFLVSSSEDADVAIADLIITYERESVVDFTMPFMSSGISIVFKSPDNEHSDFFTFFSPLSTEVWIGIGTAYLSVSFVLYAVARLSPYEWIRKHRKKTEDRFVVNQFNLSNSFLFTAGSFTQQGSNIMPRSLSTRILASVWWFFTLITLSSYTANLAAYLTADRMVSTITSVEDLEKNSDIRYGCTESGSAAKFLKTSEVPLYKRMWTTMESSQPTVLMKTEDEGIRRVQKGSYAFFMESTSVEYLTERHCDLSQIGGLLDSKGYGIATPSGSPYHQLFSNAILKLQEKGVLYTLKEKWWKSKERKCTPLSNSPVELEFRRIGGLFIFLLAGIVISTIIFIMEYTYKRRRNLRKETSQQFLESQL